VNQIRPFLWKYFGAPLYAFIPHIAYPVRTNLLKLFGMKCGQRVRTRKGVTIDKPWNVTADDLVVFGDNSVIRAGEPIHIGKRCVISQYALLITVVGDTLTAGKTMRRAPIKIEDDVWVATDAVVMPGSHISSGVVVGARGMVDGQLPSWTICTGEPAEPRTSRVLYEQN
jgi:putative colanic acid biosynthesis acetyltransferase WcaF